MESKQIVLVTGGRGMVGRNLEDLVKEIQAEENVLESQVIEENLKTNKDNAAVRDFIRYHSKDCHFIFMKSTDADLRDATKTAAYFEEMKPTYVIHLAAMVGGLYANMAKKVQFFEDNVTINMNVIKSCYVNKVKRLVCCLSTCIFPDKIDYPMAIEDLHQGAPHPSNSGYAYAKRMAEVQCSLYNECCGTDFRCAIPTNLYGKYDQYDTLKSHVVPALIRKAYEAKKEERNLPVWGSGSPLRQFCFTPDLVTLMVWQLFSEEKLDIIALVPEEEYSIKELAINVQELTGIKECEFDTTKSDGQYQKTMSNTVLTKYLPNFKFTPLRDGLKVTIEDFIQNTEQRL